MTTLDLLKSDAEYGFNEVMKSLDGVTEAQSWSVLPNTGPDYLHTDASIHGIVHHMASVKWMYGSICFRDTELRWREYADQVAAFEPSWPAALDYLQRGHEYWMKSWANLENLEEMRPTNWKSGDCEAWKIIRIMSQHDSYHAGQIAVLRYGVGETDIKPSSAAEDVRTYCRESAHW